jgi:hypothetical protein
MTKKLVVIIIILFLVKFYPYCENSNNKFVDQGEDACANTNSKLMIPDNFYLKIIKNKKVYHLIKKHCLLNGVPIELGVTLCWGESRFVVDAKNINPNGSIDRGLFQLNSRFYTLELIKEAKTEKEIYYPYINVKYGIEHLGDELRFWQNRKDPDYLIKSLMSYNCGRDKVLSNNVPVNTYIHAYKMMTYLYTDIISGYYGKEFSQE